MFKPRYYQDEATNATFNYWLNPKNKGRNPILELPTGAGKSLIQAMIARVMFEQYGQYRPRIIVTTPSKELAIQNAEKLDLLLPQNISIGYYSASLRQKSLDSDVTVATIDSIYKDAELFKGASVWINDECHLGSPDGKGSYYTFQQGLLKVNKNLWSVGMTATPYKGNGVWITAGKAPIYHGFAYKLPMNDLINQGYLSKLVRPIDAIQTRIDASQVEMKGDDYNLVQLSDITGKYLRSIVDESIILGRDRKKWIAFLPDIATANDICALYNSRDIHCAVVTGNTPDKERQQIISDFKKGVYRCLVTVLALTTGFDVPDIDCIIWARNTVSKVLYSQGAGRGLRIADGKIDCLWLDFTDTTERLGPLNELTGNAPKTKSTSLAPCIICPKCGTQWIPASTKVCAEYAKNQFGQFILDQFGNKIQTDGCGAIMRKDEEMDAGRASNAYVMTDENTPDEIEKDFTHMVAVMLTSGLNENYINIQFFAGVLPLGKLNINFSGRGAGFARLWWKRLMRTQILPFNNEQAIEQLNNALYTTNRNLNFSKVKLVGKGKKIRVESVS